MALNEIETNNFFLQKKAVSKIALGITSEAMGPENAKTGVNPRNVPYHIQIWKCPIPHGASL